MRAARAASRRVEVDGNTPFIRPFDHYTRSRSRRATPNQTSRSSEALSPSRSSKSGVRSVSRDRRTSASPSLRQTAQATKTKRIPRGSAVKRPRALARAATPGVQVLYQHEADSRFPMPYPGADRDLQQARALPVPRARHDRQDEHPRHHSRERKTVEAVGTGRPGHRKVHRVESHGPRSAAAAGVSGRRTRPQSATVARVSQENGERVGMKSHSRSPATAMRQSQEMSDISFVKGQGRTGGCKRPRPMSAPPARGTDGNREKGGVSKRNGDVLLALSRMADGSSCAPSELRIMKWVVLRETYLTKLQGVVSADRKRAKSNPVSSKDGRVFNGQKDRKRRSPQLFALLTELLAVLRRITVEIVEAVERWRRGDKARPFIWGSSNYLLKAACDTEFLSRLSGLEQHLGVVVSRNPLFSHTCLDGRSAVVDRLSIRSRSGAFPLSDSGSLGVSEERIAAAATVLFREIRRERRRLDEREAERARPRSGERTRARSPSDRRRRPIASPGNCSQVEHGRDKRFGTRNNKISDRHGKGGPKHQLPADAVAAAAGDDDGVYHPCRGVHHLDNRDERENRVNHDCENQLAREEQEQTPRPVRFVGYHGDDLRRGSQALSRRPSNAPENTEDRKDSRPPQKTSRPLPYEPEAAVDRQLPEERHDLHHSDDDRGQRASLAVRRRSSTPSDLTEAGSDPRRSRLPPRRSLPWNDPIKDIGPRRGPPPREEHHTHHTGATYRDTRRATEVWPVHNSHGDDGQSSANRADRRRSTGSGDPRYTQRGPRRSLPFSTAAQNDGDDSQGLPPDDQSLDYQNGGIVYHDTYYDKHERATHGDDQNLDYYYQEGAHYAYAEDEHEEGDHMPRNAENDGRFTGQGDPDDGRTTNPNQYKRMPTDTESNPGHSEWPSPEAAHTDNAAAGAVEPHLGLATSEPRDEQRGSEAATEAPAGVLVVPTGPLPALSEETRSCDDRDPPDRSQGRMGRRGSPFNLIFNMCDGMLTDLKGLGMGDRTGGIEDGPHEYQPSTLDGLEGTRHEGSYDVPTAADVRGHDNQEEKDTNAPPMSQTTSQGAPTNDVSGRGKGQPRPPVLRGATYASLTRNIVALSKEGWPKAKEDLSGGNGGDTEDSNRILADSFSAWAERTEGRLRHRDAKAAKHYRVGRLRHAMSAWETHQASFLGSRMAEAFAGSFGLSSRFFVRFTFDALRAHAKGARVAARNRAVIATFVSHMERFGRARLRQAWRRWASPIVGPGHWGAEAAGTLENLCRHWGMGRLRAALDAWRRRQPRQHEPDSGPARPPLHAAGSFATLKGKLKAVGSFATLKGVPLTSTTSKPKATVSNVSRRQEGSSTATNADGKDEDSWAEWLRNEASTSVIPPDEELGSRQAPAGPRANESLLIGGDSHTSAGGPPALSPSRSFRGLGAALKSIKSFRDGRDKSQTQRPRLRPTASFGSPPSPPESSSALPPSIPLDPAAADSAMQVIDGFQVQHFAANRTKLRAEVARLQAREDAASTIQRALWRTPRESMVAARVSRSASLIQGMWRLRSRRRRAGLRLVRAWRARARARVATLNRALLEAAEEGDLRAVAFMLRPPTATGAVPGLGLSVGVGGADANATAGSAKETALHAAASSGGGKGEEGNRNLPAKRRKRSSVSGRKGSSTSPWTVRAPRRSSGNTSTHGSVDAHGQRSAIKNWLKGRGCSPDWVGVIRALVRAGAMIEARDGRGYTPMMTATEEGSKETVSALAALGGEVDAMEARGGKRTPLVIAAQTANAPAAAALLEFGARANLTIGDGLTPLHEAVGAGSIEVAEMLVRAGANVNATNESAGMTPLHLAVANDQHAAARLLVHSGANVCLPDSRGLTCLRLTVEMADAPTVALLLAAEPPADLSVKDENGGTVLHAACRLGLTDIAQLLLDHGADPHVRDARGRTPELVALDLGHGDCAGLFYNVDIHSYAPNPGKNDSHEVSKKDQSVGQKKRRREEYDGGGTGSSRSSDGNSDFSEESRAVAQREGHVREEGDEREENDRQHGHVDRDDREGGESRTNGELRDGFEKAIASARRTSTRSVQEQEDQAEEAGERGGERSGYVDENFEGAEGAQNEETAWGQASYYEGERQDEGYVETGGPEQEWSNTGEWVHGGSNGDGGEDHAAEAPAAPDEYYDEPRQRESSAGWQQAYFSAGNHGLPDSSAAEHEASYNLINEEYPSQQPHSSDPATDPSYDATGVETENKRSLAYQRNSYSLEPSSWEGHERGHSVELGQDGGAEDGEKYDSRAWREGSLGAPRMPSGVGEEQHEQGEAFVSASAHDNGGDDGDEDAHQNQRGSVIAHGDESDYKDGSDTCINPEHLEDGAATAGVSSSDGDGVGGVGWGGAIALAKGRSRWISLLDKSSGGVYYQNEQSGLTQWEAPEGAVVVAAPEDT